MASSLLQLKVELEKSDPVEGSERVLDMLQELSKTTVTLDMLRSTKIGKTVGKLRKSEVSAVAAKATALVNSWKALQVASKKASDPKPAVSEKKEPTPAQKAAIATPPKPKNPYFNKGPVANADGVTGKEFTSSNKPFLRKNACNHLLKALAKKVDKSAFDEDVEYPGVEKLIPVADKIEDQLYKHFPVTDEYQAQLRSRVYNLKNNERLRFEVVFDHINPYLFATMKAEDMAKDELKKKREELHSQRMEEARSDWAVANFDKLQAAAGVSSDSKSMYECPKCGSTRVHSHAQQTRSSDEPMTVFCQCLNKECNQRFRR